MRYDIQKVDIIQPYPSPIGVEDKYVFVRLWVISDHGLSREVLAVTEKEWDDIREKGCYEK